MVDNCAPICAGVFYGVGGDGAGAILHQRHHFFIIRAGDHLAVGRDDAQEVRASIEAIQRGDEPNSSLRRLRNDLSSGVTPDLEDPSSGGDGADWAATSLTLRITAK